MAHYKTGTCVALRAGWAYACSGGMSALGCFTWKLGRRCLVNPGGNPPTIRTRVKWV